jgi:AcrR family transcriptional regulator
VTATDTLTQNQAARRGRVIRAAMELAAEGGYDTVQMRDVAARAEVALGTIYRYFSSKDHLLAACQVEWASEVQRRLQTRPLRGDTPAERVTEIVARAYRNLEKAPKLTAALLTAISSPDPAVADCQRDMSQIMSAVLQSAMDGVDMDEDVKVGAARVLSHVWFTALMGWVNGWHMMGPVPEEVERAAHLLLDPR